MKKSKALEITEAIKKICNNDDIWFSKFEDNRPDLKEIKLTINIKVDNEK